ncbi:MAG: hypothetical protein H7099_18415 [Gemmatimonadaceae bacterium]|nr:hypothetical protein [Gemmatimonadaceae bacterium]
MPEMLRRFRAGLPEPAGLAQGAASREELVNRFVAALASADRAALVRLNMTRAEFAYLYFPNSRDAAMPNGMPPSLRWDLISLNSEKGINRAIDRVGNRRLTLESLDCRKPPLNTGALTMYDGCTVRLLLPDGKSFDGPLFGSIMSYGGRFKFVGYANDM